MKKNSGTPQRDENLVWVDQKDSGRGRADQSRMGRRPMRDANEFGTPVTKADVAATLEQANRHKHRTRKVG